MADFDQLRASVGRLQDERSQLRAALLAAREDVKRGRKQGGAQVPKLEARERELSSEFAGVWKDFTALTDPRQSLGRLDDRVPILLFPLRIETRFKTGPEEQPQLWVRIYPDDALVDAFEPTLTEPEIRNAQVFWSQAWRAGDDEARERAAWRDLCASHGVGRAGWIIGKYTPLNPEDKPRRDAASDVLLIVPSNAALSAKAADFWKAAWKAGGDAAAVRAQRAILAADIGEAAADAIVAVPPFNLADPPAEGVGRAATTVKVAAIRFTALADMPARRSSWSSAPRIELLPERFVLTAYRGDEVALEHLGGPIRGPLVAGPDPNAPPSEQLRPDGDSLQIPEPLRWMFDFEAALGAGMAMRIDLTPEQAAGGFDRIVVLGVRLADDASRGREHLEQLIEHHLYSRPGLSIVPQGTPTNNTEKGGAGPRFGDDPEAGFEAFVRGRPLYTAQADPLLRRDGQWFADGLALSHTLAQRIPNAEGEDQIDARAMHLALWPGTLGYMMRTMLQPVFASADIEATRQFLSRYAVARGTIPALRIGDQPYGVLPCTDFKRIQWFDRGSERSPSYLGRLYRLLRAIDDDWAGLLGRVSFIGMRGRDPHQVVLDVLGLHPASVEYHPLKAESAEQHFHHLALLNYPLALAFLGALVGKADAMALLREYGYTGSAEPEAVTKLFSSSQPRLDGPVIDEPPLSESERLTPVAAGANYIEWLVRAAETDLETLQEERGFDAGKRPRALLYLMLRHAMQLSYHLVGAKQWTKGDKDPESALMAMMAEPKYVHVAAAESKSESRYAVLMEETPGALATVAPGKSLRIADYVSRNLRRLDPELTEQADALDRLAGATTARLERAFAEHIDACSYRLDAWKQGLLHWQLERLRAADGEGREQGGGTYLGAFGWLEDVRPEAKNLAPQKLPEEVAGLVNRPGDPPLMHDPTNAGLVHAPSLNHATTAAVLRNGYLSHGGSLAVDLSSRRVRLALGILEGMRNGQPLGALLGYHFERQLHESASISVRAITFEMRRQFPLVANRIASTQDTTQPIEAIAAMNVVDGLKLVRHVESASVKTYPYGLAGVPAPNPASLGPIVDAAVAYVADINDAVADLVLAEGVHQAVNGNFDRAAATLDAFAKGGLPTEPEVIRTPRTGTALVLRTAIHLDADAGAPPVPTPLARVEPCVDAWLRARLPAPATVGCMVHFTNRATGAPDSLFVSQAALGLAAIDLVYLVDGQQDAGLRFLDDRVLVHLHSAATPRIDAQIRIAYTERVASKVSWFELEALLVSLRRLVTASRPLAPADLLRGNDAKAAELPATQLDAARLVGVREELRTTRLPALTALEAALAAGGIDAAIDAFVAEFSQLARYRLAQTGVGFAYEWRSGAYAALQSKLAALIADWQLRLDDCTQRLGDYDLAPPPTEPEKIGALRAAEMLVSTSYTEPQPASAAYRIALGSKRDALAAELGALEGIVATRHAGLEAFLQALQARDLTPFDFNGLRLDDDVKEIARFRAQLIGSVQAVKKDLTERKFSPEADALLAGTPGAAQVQMAAQALFGEDFRMVPQFSLGTDARVAWTAAWSESSSGELTRYARESAGRDFPVDDWLHGIARVREKMHHWENAVMLCEAFGTQPPQPTPLQLPSVAGEPWLALEMPPPVKPGERAVSGDRLLYTAHFAAAFDASRPVCGLLVDEWTEVIPEAEETTGVAFHYDRPNSEPPQTWLLALAAQRNGQWSWSELLGAVNDVLDSAKRRAIEPDHVQGTRYGWLLPATYAAYTFPEISISNALLRNVRIYDRILLTPEA